MKTRKSIKKRFKITKNGKVLLRPVGQDHFRAKKSGKIKRQKRSPIKVDDSLAKEIKKALKYAPRKKKKNKK
ncbi:MAG: 50S ribosomal protein L35 [Candidatus Pacebacteria bacterium]|mgnify:CR=1 FL=1|nr:50S ribosomal protein L35 [Candidatus Paceibacterota bacterium]